MNGSGDIRFFKRHSYEVRCLDVQMHPKRVESFSRYFDQLHSAALLV